MLQLAVDRPLATSLQMDFRIVTRMVCGPSDFWEGVRATLIDRDRKPVWLEPDISKVRLYSTSGEACAQYPAQGKHDIDESQCRLRRRWSVSSSSSCPMIGSCACRQRRYSTRSTRRGCSYRSDSVRVDQGFNVIRVVVCRKQPQESLIKRMHM